MKKTLLLISVAACMTASAQNINRPVAGLPQAKAPEKIMVAHEPINSEPITINTFKQPVTKSGNDKGIVTVIPIGTSANAYSYGYGGGQKTIVWADDNLNTVINIHRMGPGATPGLAGYLSIDRGMNGAATPGDWTNNIEIYNSTISGGQYYLDAARYPQGVLYNPVGNTNPANAYVVFYAPNLSATATTWGGQSHGVANLMDNSDTTKHLIPYNPPPYNYIPDGMAISKNGVVLVTDIDQDWATGTVVYQGNIILKRGIWNDTEKDVEYETQLIELYTEDGGRPANNRVAIAPDGQTAWIVTLANTGDLTSPGAKNFYPVLFKSTDAGLTWSDPINVQLDGPGGISGIVNELLTDEMIAALFNPPLPQRDEIGYTTAFDCDIVVDKYGNPHIGVMVGVTGNDDYTILTGDSMFAAYDIYSIDGGQTWFAQKMGYPQSFRGTFATDYTEDNRTQIATTMDGTKVFVTWLDTDPTVADDNTQPDVFCRGFDLQTNMITGVLAGSNYADAPNNVTYFSDVYFQAYFAATSHYIFTDGGKYTIPIVTQQLNDPTAITSPVQYKYISDFYYTDADFVFPSNNPGVGITPPPTPSFEISEIYPNPTDGKSWIMVTLSQPGKVFVEISSLSGQKIATLDQGKLPTGQQLIDLNTNQFAAGMYFVTIHLNGTTLTRKLIVR
jgi:hypothetical protein